MRPSLLRWLPLIAILAVAAALALYYCIVITSANAAGRRAAELQKAGCTKEWVPGKQQVEWYTDRNGKTYELWNTLPGHWCWSCEGTRWCE